MPSEMLRLLPLLICFLASATPSSAAVVKYQMSCYGNGAIQARRTSSYAIILKFSNGVCDVAVLDARKKVIFQYDATGIQVFVGTDLSTDGRPYAIIQADTSNPYRLFVVSLGERAKLLRAIENQYGFWLRNDCGGRIGIWTADGAFRQDPDFNGVHHQDLFTPEVVFRMQGEQLIDATPDCRGYFDEEIRSARSHISEQEIENFRADRIADDFLRSQVKGYVLKIAFCYLYTGREQQAKDFIDRVWPSSDSARLWQSITRLRSGGVLRNLGREP